MVEPVLLGCVTWQFARHSSFLGSLSLGTENRKKLHLTHGRLCSQCPLKGLWETSVKVANESANTRSPLILASEDLKYLLHDVEASDNCFCSFQ